MGIRSIKMDTEKVFDVVLHRMDRDTKGTPYTKFGVPLNVAQQEKFISMAIQAFVHGVADLNKEHLVSVQAFSGSSDLPALTADVFSVASETPNFDLAWQESFKGVQLGKGQLFWEITDVSNGLEFREIPEGGKVELSRLDGNKAIVSIKKYGAGLGITWEIIEGKKLYAFAERVELVRAKLYKKWASVHYGLLNAAAASHTTAYQAGTTALDKDIATINLAAYTIGNACKDKGFGDMATAPMILYANPLLRARIDAALAATRERVLVAGRDGQIINWPVTPRYTFDSAITSGKGVLVLPGNKIQNSVYLRELGLKREEIESLSEIRTYWTAFGGAVGETNQCNQLSFS